MIYTTVSASSSSKEIMDVFSLLEDQLNDNNDKFKILKST